MRAFHSPKGGHVPPAGAVLATVVEGMEVVVEGTELVVVDEGAVVDVEGVVVDVVGVRLVVGLLGRVLGKVVVGIRRLLTVVGRVDFTLGGVVVPVWGKTTRGGFGEAPLLPPPWGICPWLRPFGEKGVNGARPGGCGAR